MIKKIIIKSTLIFTTLMLLSGCVSKEVLPVTQETSKKLQGKTFTFVKRELPQQPFVMTPTKAMTYGLTGGIGAGIIQMFFSDSTNEGYTKVPAYYINTKLSKTLQNQYGMKYVQTTNTTDDFGLESLVREYPDVDYVLDNRDYKWSVEYFPLHWATYRVVYVGKLRLIDVEKKVIVAEGYCEYAPEYSENLPTYDALFANDSQLLKEITQSKLDKCVRKYLQEVM